MTCTRGRANPDSQTKLRLFADSAGYCQRPTCRNRLFSDRGGEDYHIAEMAHIFAAVDGGPRAKTSLGKAERAKYDNLILLCPNCHTEIDKAPNLFPDETIACWKAEHSKIIQDVLGVARFGSREEARKYIEPLLEQNHAIFKAIGPDNEYRENPEAEEARVWKRKIVSEIIPNNQAILLAIDANYELVDQGERPTVEQFRQHVTDLIGRHLDGAEHVATRFPIAINSLFLKTTL
jgi:hypothetical protein